MTEKADKLKDRIQKCKDPAEKAKMRADLDKMPLSASELGQVEQREADRVQTDIAEFHQKRGQ